MHGLTLFPTQYIAAAAPAGLANCRDSAVGLWSTGGVIGVRGLSTVERRKVPDIGYHSYVRFKPLGSTGPKFYDCMPASAQTAAKINFSQAQIDAAWATKYPGPETTYTRIIE